MIQWLFRNGASHGLTRRARATLSALTRRERALKRQVAECRKLLERQEKLLDQKEERLQFELEEARTTIRKLTSEVDALRDEVSVNERTIEGLVSSHSALTQRWKTERAIEVMREVGARSEDSAR